MYLYTPLDLNVKVRCWICERWRAQYLHYRDTEVGVDEGCGSSCLHGAELQSTTIFSFTPCKSQHTQYSPWHSWACQLSKTHTPTLSCYSDRNVFLGVKAYILLIWGGWGWAALRYRKILHISASFPADTQNLHTSSEKVHGGHDKTRFTYVYHERGHSISWIESVQRAGFRLSEECKRRSWHQNKPGFDPAWAGKSHLSVPLYILIDFPQLSKGVPLNEPADHLYKLTEDSIKALHHYRSFKKSRGNKRSYLWLLVLTAFFFDFL